MGQTGHWIEGAGSDEPTPSPRIEVGEWRWAGACAALVLAMVAIPYAVALLHPPEGHLLARSLYYGNDLSNYLAAMGDGAASSSWLVQDHFTSEPHQPAFMFPLYVLLGKIAGTLGVDPLLALALSGVLAGIALVFAGYAFAAAYLESVRERRIALLFFLFASGLGIWVAATLAPDGSTDSPTRGFAFDRAEVSTYLLFFGPPHLTLALALLLGWGRMLATWLWTGRTASLIYLAAASLGVGLLNSFSLVSLVAVASVYALTRWIATGRFPLREAVAAAVVGAVLTPLLANSLLTFALDPFWTVIYNRQNPVGSPPPWMLGFDFGILIPLAVIGAGWGRGRREPRLLLAVWVLTLAVLIYLPVPFQRRFGYGLQPALAALAALGMVRAETFLRSSRARALWRLPSLAAVATLAFAGTMLGFALLMLAALGTGGLGRTIFEPASNVAAAAWLASHSGEGDVVLCSLETGNLLGGRIRGRVVLGHTGVTLDPPRKQALVRGFFSPWATASDRSRLLAEERVTYVFLGRRERALGGGPLSAEDGFRLVYDGGEVQIYRVERALSQMPGPPVELKTAEWPGSFLLVAQGGNFQVNSNHG